MSDRKEELKRRAVAEAMGLSDVVRTFAELFPSEFRMTILVRDPKSEEPRFFMSNEPDGAHDKVAECIVKTMSGKMELKPDVDVVIVGADTNGISH